MISRRELLKSVSAGMAGMVLQPSAPTNFRAAGNDLSMDDLTWKGMCQTPSTGFSYCEGKVALRYVGGQRRLLMIQWHVKDSTHGTAGALTELRMPTTLAPNTTTSTAMTVTRTWTNWSWVPEGPLVAALANGWHIGGLWWDEEQQVLWYTIWPYYAPSAIMPFLGAVRLHDDGTVTKYGPWNYISSTSQQFRKVCWYFVPIPPSQRAAFGGRRVAVGAGTLGASGGSPVPVALYMVALGAITIVSVLLAGETSHPRVPAGSTVPQTT